MTLVVWLKGEEGPAVSVFSRALNGCIDSFVDDTLLVRRPILVPRLCEVSRPAAPEQAVGLLISRPGEILAMDSLICLLSTWFCFVMKVATLVIPEPVRAEVLVCYFSVAPELSTALDLRVTRPGVESGRVPFALC